MRTQIAMLVVSLFALSLAGCGSEVDALVYDLDEDVVFLSMLSGEECVPDATYVSRNADHGGDTAHGIATTSSDEERWGGEDNQYMGGEVGSEQQDAGGQEEGGEGRFFEPQDFPQPGCDANGCCAVSAEDAEQIRNRNRIRCRCRARFRGDHDATSLPECCGERESTDSADQPADEPAEEPADEPAEEPADEPQEPAV